MKKVSIIVPTKNGIDTIPELIKGIRTQTLYFQTEIIVIDSESNDGTVEYIRQQNDIKFFSIKAETFNHGSTRNYAVSVAQGDIVVMTVQDAKPANDWWLDHLISPIKESNVDAVCGLQIIPKSPTTNPHDWFRPQSKPNIKMYHFPNNKFKKFSKEDQMKYCGWDDVTAAYKKSALLELPFQPVMFGEDMIWAKDALSKGFKLAYNPNAQVEHYHHHYPEYTYNRTLITWLFIYKTFGYVRPIPFNSIDFIKVIYRNIKWRIHPKWILHQWSLMFTMIRAAYDFKQSHSQKQLERIEKRFKLNVPQGKTNS